MVPWPNSFTAIHIKIFSSNNSLNWVLRGFENKKNDTKRRKRRNRGTRRCSKYITWDVSYLMFWQQTKYMFFSFNAHQSKFSCFWTSFRSLALCAVRSSLVSQWKNNFNAFTQTGSNAFILLVSENSVQFIYIHFVFLF